VVSQAEYDQQQQRENDALTRLGDLEELEELVLHGLSLVAV
jgi:hypothetical protein